MNKAEFITHLTNWYRENDINPSDCHVSHGGSLLMLGLREETEDIDLTVTKGVWDKLLSEGHEIKIVGGNIQIIPVTEFIDVHLLDETDKELVFCEEQNVFYRTLEVTLRDKLKLNRPKDQADIAALRQLLTNQGTLPYWLA